MMKILSKQEISTIKSLERKREVDEGIKLARKVDSLRELASKEQGNLAKFREQSLKHIKKEIEVLLQQKDTLEKEVASKREEKLKLEAPLDLVQEWKNVNLLKEELNGEIKREKTEILEKSAELIEKESSIETREDSLRNKEENLKEIESLTRRLHAEASKKYDEAEIIKSNTEKYNQQSEREINSRRNKLSQDEQNLKYKENELILREEQVETEKDKIEKEKLHIASQQETLRKAWKHIKSIKNDK